MTRTTLHLFAVTPAMHGPLACAGGFNKDQFSDLERECVVSDSQGEPGPKGGLGPAVMVVDWPLNANDLPSDPTYVGSLATDFTFSSKDSGT